MGPLLAPGRSKQASTSVARFFSDLPSLLTSVSASGRRFSSPNFGLRLTREPDTVLAGPLLGGFRRAALPRCLDPSERCSVPDWQLSALM